MGEAEFLIPIFMSMSAAAVVIIWITTRHRERVLMIEKGMESEQVRALYARDPNRRDPLASLKWGLLLVFSGIGILLGNFLHEYFHADEGVTIGMVSVLAGIALVIFYSFASKKVNQT